MATRRIDLYSIVRGGPTPHVVTCGRFTRMADLAKHDAWRMIWRLSEPLSPTATSERRQTIDLHSLYRSGSCFNSRFVVIPISSANLLEAANMLLITPTLRVGSNTSVAYNAACVSLYSGNHSRLVHRRSTRRNLKTAA